VENNPAPYNTQLPKYIFALSFIVSLFWIIGNYTDVYAHKITGAAFEMLWLPMMAMLFILPAISVFLWYKRRFSLHSLYLWCLLMIALAVVFMIAK
jgi:hypothetical protein